ncbi:BREX system ATP-binding protein BrxD [Corallococcus sp. CA053C]|uniref:BREX system ATP-binding protein BrxD n=1 Tax=Corallococcus sp. CA053C TaxID=2316732 RepID=UPI000EA2F8BE|nr:BREX system ATP-binding protein BrxD [Corallococcus sp. CA053C]RKH14940.1 BREX system ATP-binding protein BrxD [Corallococcus sp. CA053C]
MSELTLVRRREIVSALRNGTVPRRGIETLAVGLDRYMAAIDEELNRAALGHGVFKAVRGDYGTGKTFFARWVQHRAQAAGFATAEVQISETETPLHRMETVYRRALESLRTREWEEGAFRALVDRWFYALEEEVLGRPGFPAEDASAVATAVGELLEQRLSKVSATQPQFAAALRACHRARVEGDAAVAEGLLAWLMGQPNVSADIKRKAGLKGEIDHFGAGGFLRGLLSMLQQTGRRGLFLVLDEVETIQRMRADVREKSLNAMRQLLDEVDSGRYPGLYLLVTGTPAFFEGPQGARRLPPLEQRLHVDFASDPRFDSSRAVQIRLLPFDEARLVEVGKRIRDLYPTASPAKVAERVPDALIGALARKIAGKLGGKVGIAPRLFLKKLVGDVLDRVEEHPDFDPAAHYELHLAANEMSADERAAAGIERSADDIALDLDTSGTE